MLTAAKVRPPCGDRVDVAACARAPLADRVAADPRQRRRSVPAGGRDERGDRAGRGDPLDLAEATAGVDRDGVHAVVVVQATIPRAVGTERDRGRARQRPIDDGRLREGAAGGAAGDRYPTAAIEVGGARPDVVGQQGVPRRVDRERGMAHAPGLGAGDLHRLAEGAAGSRTATSIPL